MLIEKCRLQSGLVGALTSLRRGDIICAVTTILDPNTHCIETRHKQRYAFSKI